MKPTAYKFNIKEVERLCQLYLNCQLSVFEETELEYVLVSCDFHSPIISETKDVMAVSRLLNFAEPPKKMLGNWKWALQAAACVAILLGTFSIFHHFNKIDIKSTDNDDCIVYVYGKRASAEEAYKIAENDVAKIQQFMQTVNKKNAQEREKVEQFMNHINQSK